LVGGTSSEGRLEYVFNITGTLVSTGTFCKDYFDYIDAGVVCNSLGFGSVLTSSKHDKIEQPKSFPTDKVGYKIHLCT